MNDDKSKWIKLVNGKFTCPECENEVSPLTNTADGMIEANLEEIKKDLEMYPTKVIYAVCPVCGMEYVFHVEEGELWLEPSDEEK